MTKVTSLNNFVSPFINFPTYQDDGLTGLWYLYSPKHVPKHVLYVFSLFHFQTLMNARMADIFVTCQPRSVVTRSVLINATVNVDMLGVDPEDAKVKQHVFYPLS